VNSVSVMYAVNHIWL